MVRHSEADFVRAYGARYPHNVSELRSGGSGTIYMHQLRQCPGDYRVPETDTISISLAQNGSFSAGLDLGAGYFRQKVAAFSFGVIAPRSGMTRFEIPCELDALNVSIPIARARSTASVSFDSLEVLGRSLIEDPVSVHLIRSMWLELAQGGPRGTLFVDHGVDLLILRLLRLSGATDEPAHPVRPQYVRDWRLRRSLELIEGRLGEDLCSSELAEEAGLSSTHFTALFRAATGLAPHRWVMKRRIERSCELLRDPRLRITEIAYMCGFASSQHLATVFRKHMGVTPSAYRRDRLA